MSQGTHPEIGSLVRAKDQMWDALIRGDYINALARMWAILGDIKKEDDPNNMFETILKEQNLVQSLGDERRRRERISGASTAYRKWGRDIIQILWDKHYLENKKYGPIRKQSRIPFEEDEE